VDAITEALFETLGDEPLASISETLEEEVFDKIRQGSFISSNVGSGPEVSFRSWLEGAITVVENGPEEDETASGSDAWDLQSQPIELDE
jgi:hypothetical protein